MNSNDSTINECHFTVTHARQFQG